MENHYNKLPELEKRTFIINTILNDDFYKEFHDDFKQAFPQYIYDIEGAKRMIEEVKKRNAQKMEFIKKLMEENKDN